MRTRYNLNNEGEEGAPAFLLRVSSSGIVTNASSALCRFIGVGSDEVIGNHWKRLLDRGTPSAVFADLQLALDRAEPFSGYLAVRGESGSTVVCGVDAFSDLDPRSDEIVEHRLVWRGAPKAAAERVHALFREVFVAEAGGETPLRAERAGRKRLRELTGSVFGQAAGSYERWCAAIACGGGLSAGEDGPSPHLDGSSAYPGKGTAEVLARCLRQAGDGELGARVGPVSGADPLAAVCEAADDMLDAMELVLRSAADQLGAAVVGERVVRLAPVTGAGFFGALLDVVDRCVAELAGARLSSTAPSRPLIQGGSQEPAGRSPEPAEGSVEPAPAWTALVGDLEEVASSSRLQAINVVILASRGGVEGLTALASEQTALAHQLESVIARMRALPRPTSPQGSSRRDRAAFGPSETG